MSTSNCGCGTTTPSATTTVSTAAVGLTLPIKRNNAAVNPCAAAAGSTGFAGCPPDGTFYTKTNPDNTITVPAGAGSFQIVVCDSSQFAVGQWLNIASVGKFPITGVAAGGLLTLSTQCPTDLAVRVSYALAGDYEGSRIVWAGDGEDCQSGAEFCNSIRACLEGVSEDSPLSMPTLPSTCEAVFQDGNYSGYQPLVWEPVSGEIKRSTANGNSWEVGFVQMFAGQEARIPAGWVKCDGTAYSKTTYADLFHTLGTVWDTFAGQAAPAADSFRVPKADSLFPIAASGTVLPFTTGGSTTITQANLPAVNLDLTGLSTSNPGDHTHDALQDNDTAETAAGTGAPRVEASTGPETSGPGGAHTHTITGTLPLGGSGTAYRPPYLSIYFIIYTGRNCA